MKSTYRVLECSLCKTQILNDEECTVFEDDTHICISREPLFIPPRVVFEKLKGLSRWPVVHAKGRWMCVGEVDIEINTERVG